MPRRDGRGVRRVYETSGQLVELLVDEAVVLR